MAKKSNCYVLIRTFSAGVHCGELVSRSGKEVVLAKARRIWQWRDRWTLNEIANHGVGAGSKVGEAVQEITLTEAIEVIKCTDEARANLESILWTK